MDAEDRQLIRECMGQVTQAISISQDVRAICTKIDNLNTNFKEFRLEQKEDTKEVKDKVDAHAERLGICETITDENKEGVQQNNKNHDKLKWMILTGLVTILITAVFAPIIAKIVAKLWAGG